ncbi:MAG: family 78 glycoside hydrolase catalytic domain [Bacteroidota bacterium]
MKHHALLLRLTVISWLLCTINAWGQYPHHTLPQYPERWDARWITHPDIDQTAYNLIHFRTTFDLEAVPSQFVVHVSGDNRYRLFVNGQEVGYGPQLADTRHWRYETLDLAPFLQSGSNSIAAEVMNWGVERSYSIMSFRTGFLLQGHSPQETIVNTGNNSNWKVLKNQGMHEKTVHWINGGDIVDGFYAANPTDSIIASDYPWGWQQPTYDDSHWKTPEIIFSKPKTSAGAGHGWILQPRTTPIQESRLEPLGKIARTSLADLKPDFRFGSKPLELPANSRHAILIDQGHVTLGYPKLQLSGGKGATVNVTYSEALYDEQNHKGHRDVIEGKEITGISDVIVMDGGESQIFQPIWFRAFRFIQLDIETKDQPLRVDDFYNVFSASPVPLKAEFETNNPLYQQVWDICWRGLKMCAQDNLLSDVYYEQMQYVGDLRPHLMAWTALTGDLTYFRSALEQFNHSRLPDGNVLGCYPLKATFVYPPYSLVWIDMLHDLMMLSGDQELIKTYTGEIEEVFAYYESLINENGLVGKSEYLMFIDWYLPDGGNSPVNQDGNSAILTLNYAYSLKNAAEIMEWLGYRDQADYYQAQARKYTEIVRRRCYNPEKGIYADDPAQTFYDQRASILAVLCDAHSQDEKQALMQQVLSGETHFDSRANLFYYFYLYQAMQETGVGNFTEQLKPWQEIVEMGMSATPEKRIEQHPRSEVHPWTAHPVHFYFSLVAGIQPSSPGFKTVRIQPHPGELDTIQATYPTPKGEIKLALTVGSDESIQGSVTLPPEMSGEFLWKGAKVTLTPGENLLQDIL